MLLSVEWSAKVFLRRTFELCDLSHVKGQHIKAARQRKWPRRNEFGWLKKQRRPVWLEVCEQERGVKRDCKVIGARSCRHL